MDWKKEQFLIAKRDDNDEVVKVYVNGITTTFEDAYIGIHKSEDARDWTVTDISTGYMIQILPTQKASKAWVEKYQGVILEILNKPYHTKHVREMNKCKIKCK